MGRWITASPKVHRLLPPAERYRRCEQKASPGEQKGTQGNFRYMRVSKKASDTEEGEEIKRLSECDKPSEEWVGWGAASGIL